MPIPVFLAMTASEIQGKQSFPGRIGWMSCLFSPYGAGLSNLPRTLPEGSLLILSDYTPLQGHDPELITEQLRRCVDAFGCRGLLLDLQREYDTGLAYLCRQLTAALPCPVAATPAYARELDCGVFLPPAAPSDSLSGHLAPWQGREIWLEVSMDAERITLTEEGASSISLPRYHGFESGFQEETLHCHYRIATTEDSAVFTLWRTAGDLQALLEEAQQLGISGAVGLYQELGHTL